MLTNKCRGGGALIAVYVGVREELLVPVKYGITFIRFAIFHLDHF